MGRSNIIATKKEWGLPFLLLKTYLRVLLKWDRVESDLYYLFRSTSYQKQKMSTWLLEQEEICIIVFRFITHK